MAYKYMEYKHVLALLECKRPSKNVSSALLKPCSLIVYWTL